VKGMECKSCKAFIFLSFFISRKQSQQKFFKKMKKKIFIAAAVVFSSQLYAQKDSTKNLDEVVITATKTAVKQSQTGKVVTVIDQETLQRNAGKSLAEILNLQVGMFVNGANNALGTNQDNYLRGSA
jgi:vitamin B12 transporter